jgi:hypothetical protein
VTHRASEKIRTWKDWSLCYFQGKTNEEAARLIGCPPGSMSMLLSRGRAMLRDRVTGRYRELLAGFFTAVLVQQARSATVPPVLAGKTVQAAMGLVRGGAQGVKLVSPSVESLMKEAMTEMTLARLRKGLPLLLTIGTAVLGVTAVSPALSAGSNAPRDHPARPTSSITSPAPAPGPQPQPISRPCH